ncbi:MAG: metal dependent phosphohydrolase [Solirubrobacterales bacterium]|nr:metal dependent phosphohydrolase [Solirubrobacterales bacterium]
MLLVGVAGTFVVVLPATRSFDPAVATLLVVAYALCTQVRFHAGAGETMPVQIVFVTMLFVLPTPAVPLAVVAAELAGTGSAVLRRHAHPDRLLASAANSWFSIGPVAVLVVAGAQAPDTARWPVLIGALAAQFACDLACSSLMTRLAHGVSPRVQLRVLGWVWLVDALLAPLGLVAALATVHHPYAFLLGLPLPALLAVFARERNERIQHAVELSTTYRGTALLLSDLLERADAYTGGDHTHGVVELSLLVADELGLPPRARRRVELAALLHDVGKIAIPSGIITKPGPLSDEEWAIMRTHTIEGQRMLDRVGGALAEVGQIVRASHERFDGRGYPDGLAGKEIPREAAVIAPCDAYDAMTTDRPYRSARAPGAALEEIRAETGGQFDPRVVAALERVLAPLLTREPARPPTLVPALSRVGAAR